MTTPTLESPSVPAGKVGCLLCGGFISVQGGDRARFIDHMSNEHDAKTDCHDVLLSLCVLDTKEKGFLVKSSGPRLEEIGKGQSPDYSNTFLTKLMPVAAHSTQPFGPRPRQPAPQHRRGGAQYRPMTRQARPPHVQQQALTRAAPPPPPAPSSVNVPSALQGNLSISISKVDMTRSCNMCSDTLPTPAALVEHMNRNHFKSLGGINIVTRGAESKEKKSDNHRERSIQEGRVQTPSAFMTPISTRLPIIAQQQRPLNIRNFSSPVTPRQRIPSNAPRSLPANGPRMMRPGGRPAQAVQRKQPVEVIKCNVCGKNVEKSKLSVHKLSHAQDRKNEKSNMIRTSHKNKGEETIVSEKVSGSSDIELVELEMDETSVNDGACDQPLKNANSPLPRDSFMKNDKLSNGDIECKICDKKLASNMALKMHNNLKHPVKQEVEDAEKLLEEDKDIYKKSYVENEIDKMETLELLDNLVNFLNDD